MADLAEFDDPGPLPPAQPGRLRRGLSVAIVLLLVVSMVFLAWVSGRGEVIVPTQPTPGPLTPTLIAGAARVAVVKPDGGLATMDALGGAPLSLGADGFRYAFPAWSPDGSRVAAIGTSDTTTEVHVFTIGGSTGSGGSVEPPRVVFDGTDHPPFYLYWSPDGRRLGFLTTEPAGLALRLASADGATPATIAREAAPLYWAWTTGDRLLVHSGGDGPAAFLGEVADDGAAGDAIESTPGGFRAPGLSTDGRYRAFAVADADGAMVRVVAEGSDGMGRREVGVFGAAALSFGPTGDEVAFIAPAASGQAVGLPVGPLRLLDAGSGVVRTLLAGSVVAFFWGPDGRTIAALQVPTGDDRVASIAATPIQLAAAPGLRLRLSVVRVDDGAIRTQQVVQLADAFAAQVLPYFDQYALSHRLWAPDGSALALPVVGADGTTRVVEIRTDGSAPRPIADGLAAFWSP
jgi:TolB protein